MTKKDDLYRYLTEAILTLEFRPGSDLDEVSLAEQYNLSRTPLREIFRKLAGEGYLEIQENRGARVSDMSHITLRNFFLTAPMVYSAILQLAAQNATNKQIESLKQAQLKFKQALDKGVARECAMANNQFHEITGHMADNTYLIPSFKRLLIDHARIGMTFYSSTGAIQSEKQSLSSQQHEDIIASIEARDDELAAQIAIEHWNLSRNQMEKFVMPKSLDVPMARIIEVKQLRERL